MSWGNATAKLFTRHHQGLECTFGEQELKFYVNNPTVLNKLISKLCLNQQTFNLLSACLISVTGKELGINDNSTLFFVFKLLTNPSRKHENKQATSAGW